MELQLKDYGKKFQSFVVSAIFQNRRAMKQLVSILKPDFFEYQGDRILIKLAQSYYKKYRTIPAKVVLKTRVDAEFYPYVDKIYKQKIGEITIIVDEVQEFIRIERVKAAYYSSAELVEQGKIKDAYGILRKAFSGEEHGRGAEGSYAKKQLAQNLFSISTQITENAIPTGFFHLDRLMEGGLYPGELGVFMGQLKAGKSFVLLNTAYAAASMLAGKNVVFYTLENSLWKTDRRLYRRILHDQIVTTESYSKLNQRMNNYMPGEIYIQQFPTGQATVSDLMAHLDYLADSQDFKADLVVVDYADCMRPERSIGERRFELNGIYEDLRRLAGEFKVPVWTATQTRRVGFGKKIVQADDSSESIGKPQIADVFLTLSQSDEAAEKDILLMNLAAMRESPGGRVIKCKKDYSKSLIYTVGDVDTYDLLKEGEEYDKKKKFPSKSTRKRLKEGKGANLRKSTKTRA